MAGVATGTAAQRIAWVGQSQRQGARSYQEWKQRGSQGAGVPSLLVPIHDETEFAPASVPELCSWDLWKQVMASRSSASLLAHPHPRTAVSGDTQRYIRTAEDP